jgi:MFS family permease
VTAPATYREVFAVREYRYLFGAFTLSLVGDQLTAIAVSYLVYTTTGSAGLAAATFASSYLAWLVGGPMLSGLADRFPRRRVLIVCDLARALLVPVAAIPGVPVALLVPLLFVVSLFRPPFVAARASLMPDILEDDRYAVANGVDNIALQLCQVLGFGVGGVLVAAISPRGALLVDAGTFLASALLIRAGVRPRPAPNRRGSVAPAGFLAGVALVFADRRLRAYLLVLWLASAFAYSAEGLTAPLAVQYRGGPATVGLLLASAPLGMAVGGVVLTRLCPAELRPRLILPLAALSGAMLIAIWAEPPLWTVLALLCAAGFCTAFAIPLNSLFGRAVPTEHRGRAFGAAITGLSGAQGLAMVLAGAAAERWSTTEVVGASGLLGTIAVLAVAPLWPDKRLPETLPIAATASGDGESAGDRGAR